jgi:hypothetical protein
VFCDCELIIYDRFPLIDGTLFISPIKYDPIKAISANLTSKPQVQQQPFPQFQQPNVKQSEIFQKDKPQYIYAICLKCLNNEKEHEIRCKTCRKLWQLNGGASLQIGTLYKYDIFAAFPCCQFRLNCNGCNQPIVNIESDGLLEFFSSYSEERECPACKMKAFHFIKPFNEIFAKSECVKSEEKLVKETQNGIFSEGKFLFNDAERNKSCKNEI